MNPHVTSVNISRKKGIAKHPVPEIVVNENGISGDAHAGDWHRQISILSNEIIAEFEQELGRSINPGEFAENITTIGIPLKKIGYFDRLILGDVELVVTQIGKKCHGDSCAIFREAGRCVMPTEGIFCKVVSAGKIKEHTPVEHKAKVLNIKVVTVSDRGSRGECEDKSGPKVESIINTFFEKKRWHPKVTRKILPDSQKLLNEELEDASKKNTDMIIMTGGTGIGPRDVTPEVVSAFCDKTIPGIMEAIRIKYGSQYPNALLSRSIAGIKDEMQIYAIPGSLRAASEYTEEILKTMEHIIFMLNKIDDH